MAEWPSLTAQDSGGRIHFLSRVFGFASSFSRSSLRTAMLLCKAASMIGVQPFSRGSVSVLDWMSKPAERDFRAVEGVSVVEAQKRDFGFDEVASRL